LAGKRNIGGISRPLSLYFHIPFCNTICYYCACNKIITKDHGRSAKYLKYLAKELDIQAPALEGRDGEHEVIQLHWGGGTPTFLSHDEMRQLMGETRKHFKLLDGGEYSIEVDPRKVDDATVALLGELGFNRMSVGVQDFDEKRAGCRQSYAERRGNRQRDQCRAGQWLQVGFGRSDLRPAAPDGDGLQSHHGARAWPWIRIACRFTTTPTCPACSSRSAGLPRPICLSADTKLQIMALAIKKLTDAGYVFIGMDHFAKPDDELAVAQRQGRLHRNFQGYSTYADCDMLSFGISSISKVGPTYNQNVKTAGRVLRSPRRRLPAGVPRYRADRRRYSAPLDHPGADVPFRTVDRKYRERAPDRFPQVFRR
jgi:oxygen-independent coproporphyrinogen-3 oxidase